jgi:hypothetical protein
MTSGWWRFVQLSGFFAVGGFGHHFHVGLAIEDGGEAIAHHRMIIGQDHADLAHRDRRRQWRLRAPVLRSRDIPGAAGAPLTRVPFALGGLDLPAAANGFGTLAHVGEPEAMLCAVLRREPSMPWPSSATVSTQWADSPTRLMRTCWDGHGARHC